MNTHIAISISIGNWVDEMDEMPVRDRDAAGWVDEMDKMVKAKS